MKNNDIVITHTGAVGIFFDGKITTPDGDPLEPGCEAFALRMLPGDPDTAEMSYDMDTGSGIVFPETRAGSKGLTVALLQQALKCRGFNPGNIDGDFGNQTHAALYAFRRSCGMTGETVADMAVYKKLFEEQEK